ncbi:MAG: hypothetical protein BWY13_00851 [Euryarchaeota archaeon ADurb.Bin190]|nr:MAG: hypothetical protein BWY13_00851 [Euryarchaeota archaeon ADurb.Bin190]
MAQSLDHCRQKISFIVKMNEMGQHLTVRLGRELVAHLAEMVSQVQIVLNDAVVHYGDLTGCMRVGIDIAGPAVRCPAGMAYAHALSRAAPHLVDLFQIGYASG